MVTHSPLSLPPRLVCRMLHSRQVWPRKQASLTSSALLLTIFCSYYQKIAFHQEGQTASTAQPLQISVKEAKFSMNVSEKSEAPFIHLYTYSRGPYPGMSGWKHRRPNGPQSSSLVEAEVSCWDGKRGRPDATTTMLIITQSSDPGIE